MCLVISSNMKLIRMEENHFKALVGRTIVEVTFPDGRAFDGYHILKLDDGTEIAAIDGEYGDDALYLL